MWPKGGPIKETSIVTGLVLLLLIFSGLCLPPSNCTLCLSISRSCFKWKEVIQHPVGVYFLAVFKLKYLVVEEWLPSLQKVMRFHGMRRHTTEASLRVDRSWLAVVQEPSALPIATYGCRSEHDIVCRLLRNYRSQTELIAYQWRAASV